MPQQSFFKGYKPLEADVQKQILQFLRYKNIFHYRNNTGAYSDKESGRYIRFGSKGAGDIIAIYPGGRYWSIEVKRPGGKLSDDQIEFLLSVRKAGGVGSCVESIEDVTKVLEDPLYLPERYLEAIKRAARLDPLASFFTLENAETQHRVMRNVITKANEDQKKLLG